MTGSIESLHDALAALTARGEAVAVEPEGFPLLEAVGIACPRILVVDHAEQITDAELGAFPGDRVVVKIASSRILHRSDVGGVAVVGREPRLVRDVVRSMLLSIPDTASPRFTISEFVPHHGGPGGELLASLRWTSEFGPVITVGPGGLYAETLARHLRPGDEVAIFGLDGLTRDRVCARLERLPFVRAVTGRLRGQPPQISLEALADVVLAFEALARQACPVPVVECEVNPLAVARSRLVALDVLIKVGTRCEEDVAERPLWKMPALLTPRSVALVGVSEQMNPGHVILRNLLREGFPRDAIRIIKPHTDAIDGCRAVPSMASLETPLDLLVLSVSAAQAAPMLVEAIEHRQAESVIVIPGGLEEKAGGASVLAPVRDALARARRTSWGGPLINGGNCLGIRSLPGRYDTLFIPPHKMPSRPADVSPVALLTQSGAFAVAKAGKLGALNPRYLVTVGNQMDLTVGDYLTWLADDASLRVFCVYVEGFRPGDGRRLMLAARQIAASGRIVILYRAGRTPAGMSASASHTASMAGDVVATRELAAEAGVLLVDSLQAFEDAVRVAVALDGRRPTGWRLGAVSNAGFECVAMADNLGPFTLARFTPATRARLQALFAQAHIDAVVDVHNPLDLTPMAGDETFADAVETVLADEGVDIAVIGCVPLTPALETLAASTAHGEDVTRGRSVAARLAWLWSRTDKPWVAVVDAGAQYHAMARVLEAAGIVTFDTADRALRALASFARTAGSGATE